MTRYEYVIVGGGMIADAAAKGIRELDPDSAILVLGDDPDEPYTRPALSKLIWIDDSFTEEKLPLGTSSTGAEVRTGVTVESIDPEAKTVTVEGETIEYGALLLATGGSPKTIDLPAGDRVIYFRTFADYRHLRALADDRPHVAVVGGSYIGTEIAAALVQNGCRVTLVTPDSVLREKVLPADLAERFQGWFEDAGVEIVPDTRIASGTATDDGVVLTTEGGATIEADVVVLGLGITPNTELAEAAGLVVEDGVVVDEHLRTSNRSVYAAGDVASYPDAILGRRRIEHVDNARKQGRAVGRAMVGDETPFTYTPYFYSMVFGHRYEAVGTLDSSLETVAAWAEPGEKGTVYYLDGEVVQGVLLWGNSSDAEPDARDGAKEALAEPTRFSREILRTRTLA
ncbi:NAD(P)/FAD-dependent oxidoreductase [Amnibacterium kyonggiense]|uniref:Pyridine nucleotide-disulfide oxidoreductase n=1 Tax=Amnibacterium kyonggiense TaxID=595671 RepID=A0A4R7FT08_9MICO|nr:FAD/NAD(P)-binding oxidoreductase [Amnibacterium kyonggiense]TDS81025.1 pyridine nucleotide-disulfide oxidoreductase [Amnibacterium kyonggiense]